MEGLKGCKPRVFSVEFKQQAARRLLAGESGTALSRELEVKRLPQHAQRWIERSPLPDWRDLAGFGMVLRRS